MAWQPTKLTDVSGRRTDISFPRSEDGDMSYLNQNLSWRQQRQGVTRYIGYLAVQTHRCQSGMRHLFYRLG
jgi:hypothetical protein